MLAHIFPWFGIVLTLSVSAGAFTLGDREQQLAAGAVLLSIAITLAMRDRSWAGTQWAAFVSDLCLMAVITGIALRTQRFWPLVAAGFQLLCLLTHVARMIDPGVRAWAYATGQVIFTQLYLWSIGVGVFNTWRGERQLAASGEPSIAPGATRR